MTLTEQDIERIKKAAVKVGGFGKVVFIIQDDLIIDIIAESRERVHNSAKSKTDE